jgi:hypothetical protein
MTDERRGDAPTDEPSAGEPRADETRADDTTFLDDVLLPDEETSDEETSTVTRAQPITARAVAIVSGRIAMGVIGIGVAVVTVVGSSVVPLPSIRVTPPSTVVTPVPTAQQLVCPGAVLRLADPFGKGATKASAVGNAATRFYSSTGSVTSTPLTTSDASTGGTAAAPAVISTPPSKSDPTAPQLLSGAQAQTANAPDYVGLAAAACAVATGETWLSGGSTAVGRTTLITLSNPTQVAATVNLTLFGENGPIPAPGTNGIIVAPNGQRVLSLAGFQPDIVSPVVRVVSTGGQIVAVLQESIVRGLAPGGVDIVGATAGPSLTSVIPGLRIGDAAGLQQLASGGVDFADLGAVLRLFAPGSGTVKTTIRVIPEDGKSAGTSFSYALVAGRVIDVPIGDLGPGSYTVTVVSPVPVIASGRVSSAAAPPTPGATIATDFAWVPSASELTTRAQVTIAPGPTPVLHLANITTKSATVQLAMVGGATKQVAVPAGTAVLVPVEAGATYQLTGFESLYAGVGVSGGGFVASYTIRPPGTASTPLRVFY